jgi:outer membrane protein insertion porin family
MFLSCKKIAILSNSAAAFAATAMLVLFCGCNTTKYLESGQSFLTKNHIILKEKVEDRLSFKDEMETLYKQRPTSPRKRWFYYRTKGRLRNRFGEKPVIYDDKISGKTAESMLYFLQHKGYYQAKVTYDKKIKKQRVKVYYNVELNQQFRVDSVQFVSKDIEIQKIMNEVKNETFLKQGTPLDISLYRKEVARLTSTIRNFGYANFYANYFAPLNADTTNFRANIVMTALPPNDVPTHQKYTIGKIRVFANYKTDTDIQDNRDTLYNGVTFTAPNGIFPLNINMLQTCVKLTPNTIFRQENIDLTYRKLENLNAFRLINIKTEISATQQVDIIITLLPYIKRSINPNFELNTTQGGSGIVGNNVGLSANLSLKNNNVFGNGEKSNTNVEFAVQGLFAKTNNFYQTSLQEDFSVPRFYDPVRFWKSLNKINLYKTGTALSPEYHKLLSDADYNNLKERASSRFTGGFKYISSIAIDYLQINANFGFSLSLENDKSLQINQLSLEFLNPIKLLPPISDSGFLKRLFGQQLVTSLLFKDLSFASQYTPQTISGWNRKFRFNVEQSGLEIFALNKVADLSKKQAKPFTFLGSDYSRFIRSEVDWAAGRNIGFNQSLHFHTNIGVALPYGYKNTVVPYIKQYFVGGPTSMRGWQPRALGPGGWQDPTPTADRTSFYSTGDIKAEANAEVRFGLWWIFKSALFLDVGNTWLLYSNDDYVGGNLTKNFAQQLAVTAGSGLRIDFDYSVIRIDVGYRLRYPFADSLGNYWNFDSPDFSKWNLTFGLGYPF